VIKSLKYLFTGCIILFVSCSEEIKKEIPPSGITWSEHIAPIIYKNCSPCHRPNQSGPFSLLSYADAVKKARRIKYVTGVRFMPPWPADPGYVHFPGERVLSEEEIALIRTWVDTKTPRGDSMKEPMPPVFSEVSFFGKPDMTIKLPAPVQLKGNGTDAFLMVKYPYKMQEDKYVQYVEFVPAQRKLVHHVNGHLLNYEPGRNYDQFKGKHVLPDASKNFVEAYAEMGLIYTDKKPNTLPPLTPNVVYYLPGYTPPVYNEDIGGFRMAKDGVYFLKNIHYGPSLADVADSSYLNFFFRKSPPKRPVFETQMGTFGISPIEPKLVIPPNEIKTFHTQVRIENDISVLSVNPHMHLIGTKFIAYALSPVNDTIRLIKINRWDFRWQYYYTYKNPVKIPKGSVIHVYATYDNTNKNPLNPFSPPRLVEQGEGLESMQTTEEMLQFIFTYMPYREGDEKIKLAKF